MTSRNQQTSGENDDATSPPSRSELNSPVVQNKPIAMLPISSAPADLITQVQQPQQSSDNNKPFTQMAKRLREQMAKDSSNGDVHGASEENSNDQSQQQSSSSFPTSQQQSSPHTYPQKQTPISPWKAFLSSFFSCCPCISAPSSSTTTSYYEQEKKQNSSQNAVNNGQNNSAKNVAAGQTTQRTILKSSVMGNNATSANTVGNANTLSVAKASNTVTASNPTLSKNDKKYLLRPLLSEDVGKKCFVLDLDETLVHSSFKPVPHADFIVPVEIDNQVHSVYVLKRPGVDQFLQKLGPQFEIVVFTASLAKYADPVLDMLDKYKVVKHRLFRESCIYHRGNYVKVSILFSDGARIFTW